MSDYDIKREVDAAWNEAARARIAAWTSLQKRKREQIHKRNAAILRGFEDALWEAPKPEGDQTKKVEPSAGG